MKAAGTVLKLMVIVVVAVAAGLLNYLWMTRSGPTQQVAAGEQLVTVPVVVAAVPLARGTLIVPEMVKVARFLDGSKPEGSFTMAEELDGRTLLDAVSPGEPIMETRLAPKDASRGGIAAILGPGKRAMSVQGNKVIGLAGLVRPGDKVDVLVTLDRKTEDDKPVTKLVLQNVPVLATGTLLEAKADGKEAPVDIYTLEVTPEEGETLALAATQGTLNFALRGSIDDQQVLTEGCDVTKALAAFRPAPPPRPKAVAYRAKAVHTVEVIRGEEISKVNF